MPEGEVLATESGLSLRGIGLAADLAFVGARSVAWDAREPLPSWSNYLIGRDPSGWRTHVRHYASLRADEVYSGIDAVAVGDGALLRYDFIVWQGARTDDIRLRYDGVDELRVDATGALVLTVGERTVLQRNLVAYQDVDGERVEVSVSYLLHDDGTVGFEVGDYDAQRPLIIDPTLVFLDRLGGEDDDRGFDIEVGPDGFLYAAGSSGSINEPAAGFPIAGDPIDGSEDWRDAYFAKMTTDGELVWSTYFGGASHESGTLAVDIDGTLHIGVNTGSTDMPLVDPIQTELPTINNAPYIGRLSNDGASLLFGTYLGGTEHFCPGGCPPPMNSLGGVGVDKDGATYAFGYTDTLDFPGTEDALLGDEAGQGWLAKIDPAGALAYATYLPGRASGLFVDEMGYAYLTGESASDTVPTTSGVLQESIGLRPDGTFTENAYVMKLLPDGSDVAFATYLGGDNFTSGRAVEVDRFGNVYVAGRVFGAGFADTLVYDEGNSDNGRVFVAKLSPDVASLVWSTAVTAGLEDQVDALALLPDGSSVLSLVSYTADHASNFATVIALDPRASDVRYLERLGEVPGWDPEDFPSPDTRMAGLAVDALGDVYALGYTNLSTLPPTLPPVLVNDDTILAKVRFSFDASFSTEGSGGVADHLEVTATSPAPIAFVEARIDGGPWLPLTNTSGDLYESDAYTTPHASLVQFRAHDGAGNVAVSDVYLWPYGEELPDDAPGFAATFVGLRGNPWWIETDVAANEPVALVEVSVSGGDWLPLVLRSWGSWAAAHRAPEGSTVRFRATSERGATVVSPRFRWPEGAPVADDEPFSASFSEVRGNNWWVEVDVSASDPLAGVDAQANGGEWRALSPTDWGSWASSFFVADGSRVRFRARSLSGEEVLSGLYRWPDAVLVDDGAEPEPFGATFSNVRGNEWWVEVDLSANEPVAAVNARVDGGAWMALSPTDWGSWAASFFVPAGATVEFQAVAADGATDVSAGYTWPP